MRVAAAALLACLFALDVSACGGAGRSVASYCSTYRQQKAAYLQKYDRANAQIKGMKDPLAAALFGAGMTASAFGDIEVMFDKLAQVAPNDIAPDVRAIRDSLKSQLAAMGAAASDPLAAIASSLFSSFATSGSWQRVGDWTVKNCGAA